jgi:hypothetical protein
VINVAATRKAVEGFRYPLHCGAAHRQNVKFAAVRSRAKAYFEKFDPDRKFKLSATPGTVNDRRFRLRPQPAG